MGDHHVHLHPHGAYNGVGPPPGTYPDGFIDSFVEHGLANGADEIGFTEHLYRCHESADVLGRWWENARKPDLAALTIEHVELERTLSLDRYVEVVTGAKDRALPVLLGLEVDFFPETIEAVLELLDRYPFDFLVGSTHWVREWGFDLPTQVHEFDRRGARESYVDYFEVETQLAASGAVDVLAHTDVVKKLGVHLAEPPIDLYEALAVAAGRSGVAIEVSTAGLYQPAREMYPHPDLLSRFFANGVPITIASDAHYPEQTGRDRSLAVDFARSVGYRERVTFTERKRRSIPLE
ncbi:MAG: PHP domain-containing protein [Acidimicrobiia bacterium]